MRLVGCLQSLESTVLWKHSGNAVISGERIC